jgi:cytochrome c-type biogenesis protein CcmH/NrfG
MMGIIHGRLGLLEGAEKLYKYGLNYSGEEEILLKNYHALLVRSNRLEEADEIASKLKKYVNANPFTWITLADKAYQNQDYSQAIILYRKAAKMANYLHEPYAGIARAKYRLGKNKAASDSMLKALANSHNKETTQRYQTKYEFFQSIAEAKQTIITK